MKSSLRNKDKGRQVTIDDAYNNKKLGDYKEFEDETKMAEYLRKKSKRSIKDER